MTKARSAFAILLIVAVGGFSGVPSSATQAALNSHLTTVELLLELGA